MGYHTPNSESTYNLRLRGSNSTVMIGTISTLNLQVLSFIVQGSVGVRWEMKVYDLRGTFLESLL